MSRAFLAAFAGLALLLGLQTWRLDVRSAQRDQARAALERAEARHILFAERVRTKAEEIGRKALERARHAEAEQDRISQETSRDHQNRLAQLRARYDRLLRAGADRADPGRAGGFGLPALPEPARRPDGAAAADRLSLAERLLCSEQSLRLELLQRWIREQQGVERQGGEGGDPQP